MSLGRLGRLREGVYRFAGAGFSYPTSELSEFAAGTVPVLDELGLFDYAFALPVVEAAEALADADLGELQAAHAALFEAGAGGVSCSPHATAWIADARTGEVARIRSALRATYREFHLGDDLGDGDLGDHVATELEAMARLCADEVRRRTTDDHPVVAVRRQLEFLTGHLVSWIPTFADRVVEVDRHRAYSALGFALRALVEHDLDLVPHLLDPAGSAP